MSTPCEDFFVSETQLVELHTAGTINDVSSPCSLALLTSFDQHSCNKIGPALSFSS